MATSTTRQVGFGEGSALPKFKAFLVTVLHRGKVNDAHMDMFLNEKNMHNFQLAFTHKSFDPKNNYELLEFIGDGILGACIVFYIHERFPRIRSVKWLTRLKHNLSSKRTLARLSLDQGFREYIRYGDEMQQIIDETPDLMRNFRYLTMLEDVMEAFFGVVTEVVRANGRTFGLAVEICNNIIKSFLDPIEINLKYDELFDGITRIKEMYESKKMGLRWPTKERKEGYNGPSPWVITRLPDDRFSVTIYGWPKNNRAVEDANKVKLATAISVDRDEAKAEAAVMGLKVLANTWRIQEIPPDPYER